VRRHHAAEHPVGIRALPTALTGTARQHGEDEFLVVTLFDSLAAVRAFAGADYEVPVIEPEAARLLSRGDERAAHYDVVILPA
jgi:heme-degrading monooxygenase HmoA